MAGEVRDRIGPRASGEETVNALNRYIFTEQGFKGNTKNYYEVENSYLNCVMDRRIGIPISLSAIYLFLGQRLGLPVFGIGMHRTGTSAAAKVWPTEMVSMVKRPFSYCACW